MDFSVISISRALGAGGDEIAREIASRLGFRLVDEEIIVGAADKAGVSPETIAKVERTPSLIDRIMNYMGTTQVEPGGYVPPPPDKVSPAYESLIEQVVRETAAQGSVVILAHGASIPLAQQKGVLRVLITGSPDARAARLTKSGAMSDRQAKKAIQGSDRERREYLRRFYGIGTEVPTHYDIVLNTDVLEPSGAAGIIASAVTRP
jgi:cytidylate kinase